MTTQMLYDSRDMFLESYKAQESQGLTLENEGLLVTFGERDFMSISCTVLEQSMDVYMFVENDMMYTITSVSYTHLSLKASTMPYIGAYLKIR